jgi:tetratricopeptide (TPR) repeat protein
MSALRDKSVAILVGASVALLLASCATAPKAPEDEGKIPITTRSKDARELFVQARDLNERLRGVDALPLLERAVELDPTFAQGHWLLAQVRPTAAGFFESLEQAKTHAAAASEGERLVIAATQAGVDGDTVEQEDALRKLVAAFPQDERAHQQLATFLFGQQQWPDAIAEYEKAIAIAPAYSAPYNQLGYAYRSTEQYDQAESAFRKYIELIPDDPNPYDSYAELLLKLGRYEESIAQYEKALEQDPSFPASFVGIATNLDLLGRHDEARARLAQLYAQAKNDGQRRGALGATAVSYLIEGDFEAAFAQVQKQYDIAQATADYPAMAGDVGFMGNILLEMGRYEEAGKRFEESVALQEQAQNTTEEVKELARLGYHYNAGRIAAWSGDLAAAKEHLQTYQAAAEAKRNQFQLWNAHQLSGIIALQEKNWDAALSSLGRSNPLNPYNSYLLGMAYRGKGDAQHAQEQFDRAANFNVVGNAQLAFARQRIAGAQG